VTAALREADETRAPVKEEAAAATLTDDATARDAIAQHLENTSVFFIVEAEIPAKSEDQLSSVQGTSRAHCADPGGERSLRHVPERKGR
jgi:hypothetical protein